MKVRLPLLCQQKGYFHKQRIVPYFDIFFLTQ